MDLRRSSLAELQPHRDWKKFALRDGGSVTLQPGGILMARIYERFALPPEFAGKIEGRSSFARLGLMVHCTGDFINPGWSGFMPLQLYNAGPFPLQIYPYIHICQLMVVQLSSTPSRTYGDEGLQSKYMNDDGGPSYWWRDRRVARLNEMMTRANLPLQITKDIVASVRFQDPDLLEHFENFVMRQPVGGVESADAILQKFSESEDRRRIIDRFGKCVFPLLAAASIGAVFAQPYGSLHFALWATSAASAVWWAFTWLWQPAEYLGARELREAQHEAQEIAAPSDAN